MGLEVCLLAVLVWWRIRLDSSFWSFFRFVLAYWRGSWITGRTAVCVHRYMGQWVSRGMTGRHITVNTTAESRWSTCWSRLKYYSPAPWSTIGFILLDQGLLQWREVWWFDAHAGQSNDATCVCGSFVVLYNGLINCAQPVGICDR